MLSIEEREQNLFNATDTLAQFYDKIETFLAILFGHMERAGYTTKGDRLRSGTFNIRNLTRRLLATAMVVYVKGVEREDTVDDEDEQDDEDQDIEKAGKAEIPISEAMRIPFVQISLFTPRAIPSVRTLSSPMLQYGAVGELTFAEKKTGAPATPESPALALSNLANIRLPGAPKKGDAIEVNCGRPKRMKKFKLKGRLVGFEILAAMPVSRAIPSLTNVSMFRFGTMRWVGSNRLH